MGTRGRGVGGGTPPFVRTVLVLLALGACASGHGGAVARRGTTATRAMPTRAPSSPGGAVSPTRAASSSPTASAGARLVRWTGPVEHLFFHTLVIRPELAFADRRQGQEFRDYFVTVTEFRRILDQLYAKGWTLVDLHKAVAGRVEVPRGRKPFVLSEDDVNYYSYEHGLGLGTRLVLARGAVKVEEPDARGGTKVTNDDLVPLVDEFVARHPDFSAEGAKGVLAPTGFEGLLGERVDQSTAPDVAQRRARVKALAAALTSTGWTFASHGYGHIDFAASSLATARRDIERWKALAEPLIGRTDLFIYPFGAQPPATSPVIAMLRHEGYRVLCDIDVVPRIRREDGLAVMSRRHIDGLALRQQRAALLPLFDTRTVIDASARTT